MSEQSVGPGPDGPRGPDGVRSTDEQWEAALTVLQPILPGESYNKRDWWTHKDVVALQTLVNNGYTNPEIAAMLDRTTRAVRSKRWRDGIRPL